jgi:transketolase
MRRLPPKPSTPELDAQCVNTIRFLAVDAVENANSGHPGLPMGAATMAYVLFTRFLRHDPSDPGWLDRDRFVLSAGHGSALLYSLLHLTGYDLPMQELRNFRQWGSKTPGHPERDHTPGVEVTTGPLGQGFANAVGLAIAEAHLAARFNRDGHSPIDHHTYVLASDGDLMEGLGSEAASLAGRLKLGKLICLYDDNRIMLSGSTEIAFDEDRGKRFEAYGWHVQTLADGNDIAALQSALQAAHEEQGRPSLLAVRTHIAYGAPHAQGTFEAHGAPLGAEEVRAAKRALGFPEEPAFLVPERAGAHLRGVEDGAAQRGDWQAGWQRWTEAFPALARELDGMLRHELRAGWDEAIPAFPADPKGMATRTAAGKVLRAIAPHVPALIGGSADLNPSTNTALPGLGDFLPEGEGEGMQGLAGGPVGRAGRNLHFGVREHAMGGVLNGLSCHGGLIPYGATFLVFSDYMRPSMRLAALTRGHVIYVFTHDSIALGEDGPTHQPVEQLVSLRAIPGLVVLRPCDANEAAEAWRVAVTMANRPVALVLTRQTVPTLDRSSLGAAQMLRRGAYVLADWPQDRRELVLLATGSEVAVALQARARLEAAGVGTRVVSMPSWELFDEQDESYRSSVLPAGVGKRMAIEAGSPLGWHRFVGEGVVLGVTRFGASAPGKRVLQEYGFDEEQVFARAMELVRGTQT